MSRLAWGSSSALWNILILAPPHFFDRYDPHTAFVVDPDNDKNTERFDLSIKLWRPQQGNDYEDVMLAILVQVVPVLADIWQELSTKLLEECNAGNTAIMNPKEYVHLLYDDATFQRSRFYFWAIGCLSLFEQSIIGALLRFDRFRIQAEEYNKSRNSNLAENKVLQEFDFNRKALEDIRVRLTDKLIEMKALRDGVGFFVRTQCTKSADPHNSSLVLAESWKVVNLESSGRMSNF